MSEYEYEKYACEKETLKETIEKYGVAIVPNVLNDRECADILSGMWDFFEHITQKWEKPISRSDKTTWRSIYSLYPMHSMLFQHWNIGQAQVSWNVRQNAKIVDIFSHFWKCKNEELLVSFDGLSFNIPPEVTNRGWNRNNTWYHSDQCFKRNNLECIQSWVTGLDVEDGDATLAFYEGSHKYHKECAEKLNIESKVDWYKLNKDEERFYIDKGCEKKKIKCPKGSIVLWDSRTIHCGVEAKKKRKSEKFRSIIYVCYQPRQLATAAYLKKKQKAFNEFRTTSHWPCKGKLFPKNPRTYGGALPEITPSGAPVISELVKKLAGF